MYNLFHKLNKRVNDAREEGFTLIEIMIVVVIIGLLASILIPLYANQQHSAILAGVQSDVASNKAVMVGKSGSGKLYKSNTEFDAVMKATPGNTYQYFVNDSQTIACLEVNHDFGGGEIASSYFLSSDGKQKAGTCPDLGDVVTPPPSTPTDDPTTPPPADVSGGGEVDALSQMAGLSFNLQYTPQSNLITFCDTLTVTLDSTSVLNQPTPGSYTWEYKFDKSLPPFFGADPTGFAGYNYRIKSVVGNIVTIWGAGAGWNDVINSGNNTVTVGWCVNNTPVPPVQTTDFDYTITPASGNSNYYACVNVTVTTGSQYPINWSIQNVNLNSYFHSITGKTPTFTNLTNALQTGSTYTIGGIDGFNKYVTAGQPRNSSQQICYNPNGSAW